MPPHGILGLRSNKSHHIQAYQLRNLFEPYSYTFFFRQSSGHRHRNSLQPGQTSGVNRPSCRSVSARSRMFQSEGKLIRWAHKKNMSALLRQEALPILLKWTTITSRVSKSSATMNQILEHIHHLRLCSQWNQGLLISRAQEG